jgi:hypothetical protein
MVGFAIAHGAAPLILIAGLLALPGSLVWVLILLFPDRLRIPLGDSLGSFFLLGPSGRLTLLL